MSKALKVQLCSEIWAGCVVAGLDIRGIDVTVDVEQYWGGRQDWVVIKAHANDWHCGERFRWKDMDHRGVPMVKLVIKLINRALQHSIYGAA